MNAPWIVPTIAGLLFSSACMSAECSSSSSMASQIFEVVAVDGGVEKPQGYATLIDPRGILVTAAHVVEGNLEANGGSPQKLFARSVDNEDETFPIEAIFDSASGNLHREDWALAYVPQVAQMAVSAANVRYSDGTDDAAQAFLNAFVRSRPNEASTVTSIGTRLGAGVEGPPDIFDCTNSQGVLLRTVPFEHGQSGSPVLNQCGAVLAVASSFSQSISDSANLDALQLDFAELVEWAKDVAPTELPAARAASISDALLELQSKLAGSTDGVASAIQAIEKAFDDADIIVATPVSCAINKTAELMLRDGGLPFSLTRSPIVDRLIKASTKPGTTLASLGQQVKSQAATMNWMTYLELFQEYARLRNAGKWKSAADHWQFDAALMSYAQDEGLSDLHARLDDLLPSADIMVNFKNPDATPFTGTDAFAAQVAKAKSLDDVRDAVFGAQNKTLIVEQGDTAISLGRQLFKGAVNFDVEDDQERSLASEDMDGALSFLLGGMQAAMAAGVDPKGSYLNNVVADVALLIHKRRKLFVSDADTRLTYIKAERWLSKLALSVDTRNTVAWSVAFKSFEDTGQLVEAWYLKTAELLANCVKDTACQQRVAGSGEDFAFDHDKAATCEKLLAKMEGSPWDTLENSLGIPGLDVIYSQLGEANVGRTLKAARENAEHFLYPNGSVRYVLPYPCAPILVAGQAKPASTDDISLASWVSLSGGTTSTEVPLPMTRSITIRVSR